MNQKILIKGLIGISFILSISCKGRTEKNEQIASINPVNNNQTQQKMTTIQLTQDEFQTKIMDYKNNPSEWKYLGDKPAIIDFYADWCAPCRMVAPVLEELAGEYSNEIYIYKVDTEKEQELAAMFGIRSIPSILFIPKEGQPQMAQGALPKQEIQELIKTVLLANK